MLENVDTVRHICLPVGLHCSSLVTTPAVANAPPRTVPALAKAAAARQSQIRRLVIRALSPPRLVPPGDTGSPGTKAQTGPAPQEPARKRSGPRLGRGPEDS